MTLGAQTAQARSWPTQQTTARRLRILLLAPFAPRLDAAHGGGRIIAQWIAHMAEKHEVALCYLWAAGETAIDPDLARRCRLVEQVRLPDSRASRPRRAAAGAAGWQRLLAGIPLWASSRYAPGFAEQVQRVLADFSPDIIQLEYHVMGQYLGAFSGCQAPVVLVEHEPGETAAWERIKQRAVHGYIVPWLDLLAWWRFERELLRKVKAVVVFTGRDRAAISRMAPFIPVHVIPPGLEVPEQPLDPVGVWPPSLLFAGSFNHPPNVDAAVRLIERIFPAVRAQIEEARLTIAGPNPPERIRKGTGPNVTVTGFVPDITPYLDQASLVVAPLWLGGGMRVKVMEALAAGKALVATPLAVEGLHLADGEQVVLAETDAAFSAAVVRLLANPGQRAVLAASARDWACRQPGWDAAAAAYEAFYEALIDRQELS